MLFHTWVFFVFFLIVYPVYLLVRTNNRLMNLWLMLASYTFYGWWNPWYLLLLFGTSAIDYLMVILMERKRSTRKLWLIISLVSNFGFLGYFKYSGFITDNLNTSCSVLGLLLQLPDPAFYPNTMLGLFRVPDNWYFQHVILPIGISFHTFQSMSYTIDAYKGIIQTERGFRCTLTFVSFFPQLVAGPMSAPATSYPSYKVRRASRVRTWPMACRCSWSVFSKVALADYLAKYVDPVYGNPGCTRHRR